MLISGPEVRRKRNWSEIRIFMPAAGSLRSRTPSSTASENYWYVLRKKPITILLLFILLLPLLFGERSFLSIASYLRIGSKKRRKHSRFAPLLLSAKIRNSRRTAPGLSAVLRGATKLSLPTLVNIANALEVTVDELLCDSLPASRNVLERDVAQLLSDCSHMELKIITETILALKESLRKANLGG